MLINVRMPQLLAFEHLLAFIMLTNVKMPTIVGILTFISIINTGLT